MLEATPGGQMPPVFDQRNLSFAEATVHALDALGVLPLLRAPSGRIRRIHVSRAGDFGRIQLDAAAYGRAEFGRVVVARDFGEALEARLSQLRTLTRHRPARFIGLADEDSRDVRAFLTQWYEENVSMYPTSNPNIPSIPATGPDRMLVERFPEAVAAPLPHGRGWAAAIMSLVEERL